MVLVPFFLLHSHFCLALVVAVVRVDAELVDDLKGVFAPVLDINEGGVQRRAVVAGEGIDLTERFGRSKDIGGNDLIEQAGELAIGEVDAVEGLKFFAEILFQREAVADVIAIGVLQIHELGDEFVLDVSFSGRHAIPSGDTGQELADATPLFAASRGYAADLTMCKGMPLTCRDIRRAPWRERHHQRLEFQESHL